MVQVTSFCDGDLASRVAYPQTKVLIASPSVNGPMNSIQQNPDLVQASRTQHQAGAIYEGNQTLAWVRNVVRGMPQVLPALMMPVVAVLRTNHGRAHSPGTSD